MPRAREEAKELRRGVKEVGDLRQEEEEHGFGEVTEYASHSEGHTAEVAEGVPDEHCRWIPEELEELEELEEEEQQCQNSPIMFEQRGRHKDVGKQKIDGQKMALPELACKRGLRSKKGADCRMLKKCLKNEKTGTVCEETNPSPRAVRLKSSSWSASVNFREAQVK